MLRGRPFQQFGPRGYQLAHLLDHKDYKCRLGEELTDGAPLSRRVPYGLYTCATNAAYVPSALLRPTDHSGGLRGLLQRRALELYGAASNLVPPPARPDACRSTEWDTRALEWAAPVGDPVRVPRFLAFRSERMESWLD